MGKSLKYGSHDFPSKFGFSGSAGDGPVNVRPHVRARRAPKLAGPKLPGPIKPMSIGKSPLAKALKMADGGTPSAVPTLRPTVDIVDPGGALSGGTQEAQQKAHESEAVVRGHAPFTAGALAAAVQNAAGIMDPVKMGVMTGVEHLMGQAPGTLGGMQDIPGYEGYTPKAIAAVRNTPMTMQQAQEMDATDRGRASRDSSGAVHGGSYGAGDVTHENTQTGQLGHIAKGGRIGFKKGGRITAKQRHKMPAKDFGLPASEGFPMQDKKHQRLAISGASRSEHAGNISHSTAEKIKAKARGRLKMAKGGCVTEPEAERIAEQKVAAHNANPRAHGRRGVPAFKSKPLIGD